jgi:hypothetical protein
MCVKQKIPCVVLVQCGIFVAIIKMFKLKEVLAKSILTPSQLPGADFVINPYSGCQFGCVYCYADFMRRFSGHGDDKWEELGLKIVGGDVIDHSTL